MKCIFLCFRVKVSFLFFRFTPRLVFILSFTYFFRCTFPLDTFRNYPSVIRKIFAMYFVANHAFRETRSFFHPTAIRGVAKSYARVACERRREC